MNRLDTLSDVASRQLGGLKADDKLFLKIRLAAAEQPVKRRGLKPVLAVCAALVVVLGAVLAVTQPAGQQLAGPQNGLMDSRSAGGEPTAEPGLGGSLPQDSLTMSAGVADMSGTLFEAAADGSFPLVTLEGATYRLLESPAQVDQSLLGDALGEVTEFNVEPALGSGGIVSNAVSVGETVYAIAGMDGALVAAPMRGSLRLFQRVSYGGKAIIGSQTLGDTLCDPADVAWMEMNGRRVDDTAAAQNLMQTLLDDADYQSTAMTGSGQMQIGLKNGLTLQLLVGDDCVSACGTWTCPEFMQAFESAAR